MIFDILTASCPLLLSSMGALFSEFAGVLAMFMESLICLGGFLTYTFTVLTGSLAFGVFISLVICTIVSGGFYYIIHKVKAHVFISGIALNLLFSFLTSFLSVKIFGTRGVLTSDVFNNSLGSVTAVNLCICLVTAALVAGGIFFVGFTRQGLCLRVSGYNPEVLRAKGDRPHLYKTLSWALAGAYAGACGTALVVRISSYVPNISSGRGWMALAAVYLGQKNPWKIALAVIIFCATDYFTAHIQNFIPGIPTSALLSLPYLVMIALILTNRTSKEKKS